MSYKLTYTQKDGTRINLTKIVPGKPWAAVWRDDAQVDLAGYKVKTWATLDAATRNAETFRAVGIEVEVTPA